MYHQPVPFFPAPTVAPVTPDLVMTVCPPPHIDNHEDRYMQEMISAANLPLHHIASISDDRYWGLALNN